MDTERQAARCPGRLGARLRWEKCQNIANSRNVEILHEENGLFTQKEQSLLKSKNSDISSKYPLKRFQKSLQEAP
jgi:hypothetical protein